MTEWLLAEAKNRFSEVVTLALTQGPQRVRRRNESVVVIAQADYDLLVSSRPTFKEYLFAGPSFADLDLSRSDDPMRDIRL